MRTVTGEAPGLPCRYSAATPATCGAAIDVPLMVLVAVLLVYHDEVMDEPGAKMSRHVPKFEYEARESVVVVAPTVIAAGVRAGENLQASRFEFPAAMAYVTPSLMELVTALSSAVDAPPPRLMLATAGAPATWSAVTQSMPAMTPEVVPLPAQSSTRTATSETPLATPYVEPPVVPATCVPCPLQSSAVPPSTASKPLVARPPNSLCENRIPVSMM